MIFTPQTIIDVYHKRGETRLVALRQPPEDIIAGMKETLGEREVAARLLAFEMMMNPEDIYES